MRCIFSFLFILFFNFYLFSEKASFIGLAYEGSELLFKEEYIIERIDGHITSIETHFFSPSGEKIAQMSSTFSAGHYLPKLCFSKKSSPFSYSAQIKQGFVELFKQSSEKSSKKKKLNLENNMVAGPGFYLFIVEKLDKVLKGEKEHLLFIQPNRLGCYKFNIEAEQYENYIEVNLKIDNPILKKLIPPIHLKLDKTTRALISYKGLSGFLSEDNSLKPISVTYSMPQIINNQ